MKEMYKGKAFSPNAILTKAIGPTDSVIEVSDIDAFPDGPNLATIGTDEFGETVLYAAKVDNKLSGCVRGVEGESKSWQVNEIIARNFTNKDLQSIIDNIERLDTNKVEKLAGKGLSEENYTTIEKEKLSLIEEEANKTTLSDNISTDDSSIAASSKAIKTVNDKVNTNKAEYTQLESRVERLEDTKVNSWEMVQVIVRAGLAHEYFRIGDQMESEYDGGKIIWEVIGIDIDTPADPSLTHSMTLQTKDCLHDIQFDAPEPSNPDSNRKSYGNNRYIHSAVRQWLNSDESTFIWQSQHQYDAKPTGSLDLYNGAGFLNRLDPELVAVLGNVKKKVARNTVTDGGGQEEFTDKVFLLSQLEVDLGTGGTTTGEFIYPFYQSKGNANRIKNLNTSPRSWWLRSPYVSLSNRVRSVYTSGALSSHNANTSYGLSPACSIV